MNKMHWYKITVQYNFEEEEVYFISSYYSTVKDVLKYDLKGRFDKDKDIYKFRIKQASPCEGCRHNFPGQEAHMKEGGCLEN